MWLFDGAQYVHVEVPLLAAISDRPERSRVIGVIFVPTSFDLVRNMIHKRFLCQFPVRKNVPVAELMMRQDGEWIATDLTEACTLVENAFLQSSFLVGLAYHSVRDRMLHSALVDNADAIFEEARALSADAGATFVLVFLAAPWECHRQALDFDLRDLESEYDSMLEHCPEHDLRFPTDSH